LHDALGTENIFANFIDHQGLLTQKPKSSPNFFLFPEKIILTVTGVLLGAVAEATTAGVAAWLSPGETNPFSSKAMHVEKKNL